MKDHHELAMEHLAQQATWMEKTGGYAKDMTLRDYFAGLVVAQIIKDQYEDGIYAGDQDNDSESIAAFSAYIVADAMLKERNPKPKSVATPLDDWALTVRVENCLRAGDIYTVEQLSKKSQWELYKIPNMGWKSVREVVAEAAQHGITIKER